MTKFILYKNNMTWETTDINLVERLKQNGWKLKISELGQLI